MKSNALFHPQKNSNGSPDILEKEKTLRAQILSKFSEYRSHINPLPSVPIQKSDANSISTSSYTPDFASLIIQSQNAMNRKLKSLLASQKENANLQKETAKSLFNLSNFVDIRLNEHDIILTGLERQLREKFDLFNPRLQQLEESVAFLTEKNNFLERTLLSLTSNQKTNQKSLHPIVSVQESFALTPLPGKKKRIRRGTPQFKTPLEIKPEPLPTTIQETTEQQPLIAANTPQEETGGKNMAAEIPNFSISAVIQNLVSTPKKTPRSSKPTTTPHQSSARKKSGTLSSSLSSAVKLLKSQLSSKHRESLANPQPSNDSQDGPLLHSQPPLPITAIISKDSNSLLNPQPSNADQDGPENDDEDDDNPQYQDHDEKCQSTCCNTSEKDIEVKHTYKCPLCIGKWTTHVTLFKHLFNLHYDSLPTLPLTFWKSLTDLSKQSICYPCKRTWSYKKSACSTCNGPLGSFESSSPIEHKMEANFIEDNQESGSNISYFSQFSWPKLLEISSSRAFCLRPQDLLQNLSPNLITTPIMLTKEIVLKALSSFSDGSSSGPSGLSPLILKRCCNTPSNPFYGDNCLISLTLFLQKLIDGSCPSEFRPFIFGASLIAIKKKDGGTRPIAIGETIRRLAAKLVLQHLDFPFAPFQSGIKTNQGMEKIIHQVRRIVDSSISQPSLWKNKAILKVDLKNAFNNISRSSFLKIVQYCFPSFMPFISSCYDQTAELIFSSGDFIHSAEGVQQGDPLGPALFSLVLQSLVLKIDCECSTDLNRWYLDDGVLIGTPEELQRCLHIISSFGAGITLNLSKCEIFTLDSDLDLSSLPLEIQRISSLDILGSPITDIHNFTKTRIKKVTLAMEDLLDMEHMQSAFVLFKNCFGPLKINHLLRTVPPTPDFLNLLKEWDSSHAAIFSKIMRFPIAESSLNQSILPNRLGGLGLRCAYQTSLGAFLGSLTSCLSSLIGQDIFTEQEEKCLDLFNECFNASLTLENLQSLLASSNHLQKALCNQSLDFINHNFTTSLSEEDKLWIFNCKSDSSSWFSSPPIRSKGIWMTNSTFQIAILQRLRADLFPFNTKP